MGHCGHWDNLWKTLWKPTAWRLTTPENFPSSISCRIFFLLYVQQNKVVSESI